jgi:hypothetical protein
MYAQADIGYRGVGIEAHLRLGPIMHRKSDGVVRLAAQGDVWPPLIFAEQKRCLRISQIGQLAVQGMLVAGSGHTHRRHAAMDQKAAIGGQVIGRGIRLLEHRLHGQIDAHEGGPPDLLALKRQKDQFAGRIGQPQTTDSGRIEKDIGRKTAAADKGLWDGLKLVRCERNHNRFHTPAPRELLG